MTPTVRTTGYTVSLLPEDATPDSRIFDVDVEYRGAGRWAVVHMSKCLGSDGEWDFGVKPYERGDDWLNAHRFSEEEALRRAVEVAPTVIVNGVTAAQAFARLAGKGPR